MTVKSRMLRESAIRVSLSVVFVCVQGVNLAGADETPTFHQPAGARVFGCQLHVNHVHHVSVNDARNDTI